jgi:hypothetical protein
MTRIQRIFIDLSKISDYEKNTATFTACRDDDFRERT